MEILETVFVRNSLVVAFAVVGLTIWISYFLADKLTKGRIHGSAIAIALGLLAAYFGGKATGGSTGVADITLLGGIGLMGGGMMRDFAIVATAFGVKLSELKKSRTSRRCFYFRRRHRFLRCRCRRRGAVWLH